VCAGRAMGEDLGELFDRPGRSEFRSRFRLRGKALDYLRRKGLAVVLGHAADFVEKRLAPADPANDGKQTPMGNHPAFVAQHATATCCRGCLAKWHGVPKGRTLTEPEKEYVVKVIGAWLSKAGGGGRHSAWFYARGGNTGMADQSRPDGRPTSVRIISAICFLLVGVTAYGVISPSQQPSGERAGRAGRMSRQAEERGLAEPFKGVTTDGKVIPGLFPVRSTGVSTAPVRQAAAGFLAALTPEQRAKTMFPADDPEWRKWMNQHFYVRQGTSFDEMTEAQREAATGLLRASLSAKGLRLSRDIMRLNHTLGELNNDNFEEYGEWLYWITVMGTPSDKEPWGWQLDGHHLIINYFVMGDQVVMTPTFMGSEPVTARSGRYRGTAVLRDEQRKGLAFVNALNEAQRGKAIIEVSKGRNHAVAEAFRDNLVLDYAGVSGAELTARQKEQLLDLIDEYVRNMRDGHARVKMDEVRRHLNETRFAWIGGTGPDGVFYYRIHSPVILIEFDHQAPTAMRNLERGVPTREHVHTVVRTPNGNDYGKDLLRQHYQRHPHKH
jgi:hypothetical protein